VPKTRQIAREVDELLANRPVIISYLRGYDAIVQYHHYRSDDPWAPRPGKRLLLERPYRYGDEVWALEQNLLAESNKHSDNHHGWTVRVGGRFFRLHFADHVFWVWEIFPLACEPGTRHQTAVRRTFHHRLVDARGSKRNSTGVLPLPMAPPPPTRSATPRSAPARRSRAMKGSSLVYSDLRWSWYPYRRQI